jgi:hypothetical protein
MLPKFRSFVRPIIRSFVRSFVQIIFSLPLCCQNSDRSFVRSFDRSSFVHSSYSSFVHSLYFIVLPDNLYPAFMLPKFRSSDHSIVRPFVHSSYSSFIVRSYDYSPSLFTITIHRYYSSMINVATFSLLLFIVTIHRTSGHPKFQLLIHHAVQST